MAEMNDDGHVFEDMTPESPGKISSEDWGQPARWQRPSDFLIITQGRTGAEEDV